MLTYDKGEVLRQINSLPPNERLAFAAACCERLLPNYLAFKNDVGWGDEKPLRNALDRVWEYASGAVIIPDDVRALLPVCESVTPDADDFQVLLTGPAQDAVFAICNTLDYLLNGNTASLAECSAHAIDTVDLYVQETENIPPQSSDLESRIREHHLMQREIQRQCDDLSQLRQSQSIDEIRERCLATTKSNIGM